MSEIITSTNLRESKLNIESLKRGSQRLPMILRQLGFESMRKGQDEAVANLMGCRDVVGIFPTAQGKSGMFGIPTLCLEWRTVVFSPLVSLMRDQVQGWQRKGVAAAQMSGTQS